MRPLVMELQNLLCVTGRSVLELAIRARTVVWASSAVTFN
jgi:hypothetical protein